MYYFPCFTAKPNKQYHRGSFLSGKISSSPCSSNGGSSRGGSSSEFAIRLSQEANVTFLGVWKCKLVSLQNILPWNFLGPGFRQTASRNHTRITNWVEMSGKKSICREIQQLEKRVASAGMRCSPSPVNHNSCFSLLSSLHSFIN